MLIIFLHEKSSNSVQIFRASVRLFDRLALEISDQTCVRDGEDADTVRKGIVVAGRKRGIAPEIR